ncbi:metallophosphoesterase family protein [Thermotalea metallivorans]|uniref:Calcineurin-like phosphoesterase domain-containing protein n=1 Tax=Thermotalea metallivorans TaxID=520762 RepID=A0A140L5A4_9FIRM|nr:metallophosphoesterase [Thermotalea metallivorans]KXG75729.1 hypothetical protein AN619_14830 [Thermotalea metallivorans]
MGELWKVLYYLTGGIYIPNEIKDSSVKILHISDTPSMIYNDLIGLVKIVKPHILIHTGDIVDDVKLELLPQHVQKYKARANYFLKALSHHVQDRMIIALGNHDHREVLHPIPHMEVYEEGKVLELYGMKIGLAHRCERLPETCDFYMYGHCKTCIGDESYLNGIHHINIIKVENREVIKLFYPSGTDDYRLRRSKMGI